MKIVFLGLLVFMERVVEMRNWRYFDLRHNMIGQYDTPQVDVTKLHENGLSRLKERVRSHLASGKDINLPDEDGSFLLFAACSYGDEKLVGLLIEHGANVNKRPDSGATALDTACDEKQLEVIKLLLDHGATF